MSSVNYETDLLLITCASGKQASHILPLVYGIWKHLRLVVNSATSEDRLKKQYPTAEVIRADLCNPKDCHRIMTNVTTVFHIGPSFHPHETEIGYFMIDAAISQTSSTFQHFVYSSVLDSQLRKLMNHDCKRYVEEYLLESGLNYTILQPTHFMDMLPVAQLLAQEQPIYTANWNPEVTFSFLALKDLGEAAAKVIEERERHYLAQYPLCSTRAYSYRDVIRIVSESIGKDITIKRREIEEGATALMTMLYGDAAQVPSQTRDAAQRLLLYYNHHGLKGNPNVLEWLIERKPTTHQEWVRIQVEKASKAKP